MSLFGLLAPGCLVEDEFDAPTRISQKIGKGVPDHDEGSILVKFRNTPSVAAMDDVLASVSGKILDENRDGRNDLFAHVANGRLAKVELTGAMKAMDAVDKLQGHPSLEYAELNYILHTNLVPNDPSFGSLWGLHNTGQSGGTPDADIDAVEAWDTATGSHEIIVGVIDTGIDYTHPDLAANMWVNPGEIPGNGIDDDGNGYVDDVHGINAITNSGNPMDDNAHGTHVAGTIGAVGDDGVGVAGVNWTVSMIGMKFLSGSGSGTTADAVECIDYAVDLKNNRGVDIRVLSNSWGGGGFSQALFDSIVAANEADILFVAAAGNSSSNNDNAPSYPASYDVPNVVSVASTTRTDAMSSFSSYGAASVHLGAPGSDILSTTPGNGYSTFSGTSMATPHVSGAAALLLSVNNTITTDELKDILMSSGDPIPSLAGKTISGNRLNVASALAQVGPPGPSFRLGAGPASQTVNQGESASYDIDVTSVAGFADDVTLSLSAQPALDASVAFTPNPVAADSASTLTIATGAATAVGTYSLTIAATSGDITKTRSVSLMVRPEGTVANTYTSDTPVSIPDNSSAGITSALLVPDSLTISEVEAAVSITHTYIGDLIVELTSPAGTTVTLHNRSGGSTDNLNQTYSLPDQFLGQNSAGYWTLSVSDNAGIDLGTLNSWSLTIIGSPTGDPPLSTPPTADFSFVATDLTVSFTDASSDVDSSVTGWSWDFGDGATSTEQNPTHTYAAAGTYAVSLTATDDSGATDTASQSITVLAPGTVVITYPNDTPVSIPDNRPAGITSTIDVPDSLLISELSVNVNITHTYIGDLIVKLTSPAGTVATLHSRSGGSTDNLYRTYVPANFMGENALGTWTLSVSDNAGIDLGTLDSWSLTVTGAPPNAPPVADFSLAVRNLKVVFTDASADSDGTITSWTWDLGDGNTVTMDLEPVHVYAAAGTYTVSLTVTDDLGATSTFSQEITVNEPPIDLWIEHGKKRPNDKASATLYWDGATTENVEIYRNGELVAITENDGRFKDRFVTDDDAADYGVCEEGNDACSDEIFVAFRLVGNQ